MCYSALRYKSLDQPLGKWERSKKGELSQLKHCRRVRKPSNWCEFLGWTLWKGKSSQPDTALLTSWVPQGSASRGRCVWSAGIKTWGHKSWVVNSCVLMIIGPPVFIGTIYTFSGNFFFLNFHFIIIKLICNYYFSFNATYWCVSFPQPLFLFLSLTFSVFFKIYLFSIYVYESLSALFVHYLCALPAEARRGRQILRMRVPGSCEAPCGCWKT